MDRPYLRRPITRRAGCGNGVVEPGEALDDGQPGEVSDPIPAAPSVMGWFKAVRIVMTATMSMVMGV